MKFWMDVYTEFEIDDRVVEWIDLWVCGDYGGPCENGEGGHLFLYDDDGGVCCGDPYELAELISKHLRPAPEDPTRLAWPEDAKGPELVSAKALVAYWETCFLKREEDAERLATTGEGS